MGWLDLKLMRGLTPTEPRHRKAVAPTLPKQLLGSTSLGL